VLVLTANHPSARVEPPAGTSGRRSTASDEGLSPIHLETHRETGELSRAQLGHDPPPLIDGQGGFGDRLAWMPVRPREGDRVPVPGPGRGRTMHQLGGVRHDSRPLGSGRGTPLLPRDDLRELVVRDAPAYVSTSTHRLLGSCPGYVGVRSAVVVDVVEPHQDLEYVVILDVAVPLPDIHGLVVGHLSADFAPVVS